MDNFGAKNNVMVAQIAVTADVPTLYSKIGNTFGWLCVTCVATCIGLLISA